MINSKAKKPVSLDNITMVHSTMVDPSFFVGSINLFYSTFPEDLFSNTNALFLETPLTFELFNPIPLDSLDLPLLHDEMIAYTHAPQEVSTVFQTLHSHTSFDLAPVGFQNFMDTAIFKKRISFEDNSEEFGFFQGTTSLYTPYYAHTHSFLAGLDGMNNTFAAGGPLGNFQSIQEDEGATDSSLNSPSSDTSAGSNDSSNSNTTHTPLAAEAAVISGASTGSVSKDYDPDTDGLLETSGTLSITDANPGEALFQAGTVTGLYGSVTIDATGNWTYEVDNTLGPIQALTGDDTLSDTLTITSLDGTTQDITITIDSTIYGTSGDDTINGGATTDVINGLEGDDTINGSSGTDTIYGSAGDDRLYGGGGEDIIHGGTGADLVQAGAQNDTVYGQEGDDNLHGGFGDDTLYGGEGNDTINGADDNDTLYGQAGDDDLYGSGGDDIIDGGAGSDLLNGGAGNDTFVFDLNDRSIDGETGIDTVQITSGDFDFSTLHGLISNVEILDITGGSDLTIDSAFVTGVNGDGYTMQIDGENTSQVTFEDTFSNGGTTSIDGQNYTIYTQNDTTIHVDTDIVVVMP